MAEIVQHHNILPQNPPLFKAAVHPLKVLQTPFYRLKRNAVLQGGGPGRQSIGDVMLSGHIQFYAAQAYLPVIKIKTAQAQFGAFYVPGAVILAALGAHGYHPAGQARRDFLQPLNIAFHNQDALGRDIFRVAAEGSAQVFHGFKEFHMVRPHIEDNPYPGIHFMIAVGIFAGLRHKGFALADAQIPAYALLQPAYGHGGVRPGGQENLRHHTGGGGFAMGAGYAVGIRVLGHELA